MSPKQKREYEMLSTPRLKALWLLRHPITAKIQINTHTLTPEYRAFVCGVSLEGVAGRKTEQETIAAAKKWLQNIANPKS